MRSCNEVVVSDLEQSGSVTVPSVFVGDLSPVKCSWTKSEVKYFEGQLSDGKKTVRVVAFEPKLR